MDFERICRLCLEERDRMRYIAEYQDNYMRNIFSSILQIEVHPDDQLPQKLCWQCISALTKLNNTVQQYRANDQKLRNMMRGSVKVKTEIDEEEQDEPEPFENIKIEDRENQNDDEMEERPESMVDVELDESGEINSPAFDAHEGFDGSQEHSKVDEQGSKVITSYWKMPADGNGPPTIEIPKGKPGRPRVRPIKVAGKRRKKNIDVSRKPKKGEPRCYICKSELFDNAETLLIHLNEHLGELPYTCTICVQKKVVIDSVTSLNVHKRMHANPVKCPHCDNCLSSKKSLDLHIMMQHQELAPDETSSACTQCDKVFLTAKALRFHMNSHEQPLACEVCGKIFSSKVNLARHVKQVHEKTDRVECHICHKTLITLRALKTHLSAMHSNEQLKCRFCPRLYPSKLSLTYHEKQHKLKPNYTETMSNHWRQYYTVEGEKGAQTKTCNLCGVVLTAAPAYHFKNVHFPDTKRGHPCEQCDAVFKQKKDLEVHQLEHTYGKFLKCPICDKDFTERRYLIMHMKTKKHKDHPLAQSLDWIETELPGGLPPSKRVANAMDSN